MFTHHFTSLIIVGSLICKYVTDFRCFVKLLKILLIGILKLSHFCLNVESNVGPYKQFSFFHSFYCITDVLKSFVYVIFTD